MKQPIKQSIQEKINLQEKKDYIITNKVFNDIFNAYGYNVTSTEMPQYYNYDSQIGIEKDGKSRIYGVEIKECTDFKNFTCTIVKVDKYNLIINKAREDKVKPIYFQYSTKSNKYYIYDFSKLEIKDAWIKNIDLKKTQMDDNSYNVKTPTIFIPHTEAIIEGKIK